MSTTPSEALTILAIESSCDETSCAISRGGLILSNIIAGQSVHEQYGGVVPELASRAHLQNIVPVVDTALKKAGCTLPELHAIAFTRSPGLIGSLLVGSQFAKSLALALGIPVIAVHHMQAHVLANLIPGPSGARATVDIAVDPSRAAGATSFGDAPLPAFPFLCLTVSGGHTQIVLCHSPMRMEVIGETLDDAAGEAFDKSAKLLGLPYPGGPLIDKHAREGDPGRFAFPEPQITGLDFSFSGLKTAILYFLQERTAGDQGFVAANLADICASIQGRIVSILLHKYRKAARETGIKDLCIAGGVSANSRLRKAFREMGEREGWRTFIPPFEYCTDNAAMIAITAHYKYLAGDLASLSVSASARAEW
jgi:tRNA N6-adenosine threonylcarbamoyltransferase